MRDEKPKEKELRELKKILEEDFNVSLRKREVAKFADRLLNFLSVLKTAETAGTRSMVDELISKHR